MRYSPSCACCGESCGLASDAFQRSAVGPSWDQISGTWTIASGKLTTTSSSGIIIYNTDHPAGIAAHVAAVDMTTTVQGEKGRLLVASNTAGTQYLGIEVEFGPSTGDKCGTVRLFSQAGTLHSRPMLGIGAGQTFRVRVCYLHDDELGGGYLWGDVASTTTCNQTISTTATATGLRAGLGTGSGTANMKFDNFTWSSHDIEGDATYGDCSRCESCPIWHWDGTTHSNCEQTVAGDPENSGSAWSVAGLIGASTGDAVGGYGVIVPGFPGDITITLGAYSAHFYVPAGLSVVRVDLTGPGVTGTTEDFNNGVCASFSYIQGRLCATTCDDITPSGNRSVFGTPSSAVGTFPTVTGAVPVESILFTRCPICPSDSPCVLCHPPENTPEYFKVTIGGVGAAGTCSTNCLECNGTFICNHRFLTPGPCLWASANISTGLCAFRVKVFATGGTILVHLQNVAAGIVSADHIFRFEVAWPHEDFPSLTACDTPTDLGVPFTGSGTQAASCSNSGLTCVVSAL